MQSRQVRTPILGGGFQCIEIQFDKTIQHWKALKIQDDTLPILLPGFIDLHIHGAGGADVMDAGASVETIGKTIASYGTTSFLATTMTAPKEQLLAAFQALRPYYEKTPANCAALIGVHLEGPFISSEKLGAQPNFTRDGQIEEILSLHKIVPIKIVTLAPEEKGNKELIKTLCQHGIIVQIGHTNSSYEQAMEAMALGAKSFTHLYNAMSPMHHRAPGAVGAALAHAEYAELIPDLLHVHPGAIKAALRAIPKLYFVSDSTAATGMPDGEYKLGAQNVLKCQHGVRLQDGTLAGSCLTMAQALKNLNAIGLDLYESAFRLSTIPAQLLQLKDRGAIEMGMRADLLLLDNELNILEVINAGVTCD